jgi:hypothetical protein
MTALKSPAPYGQKSLESDWLSMEKNGGNNTAVSAVSAVSPVTGYGSEYAIGIGAAVTATATATATAAADFGFGFGFAASAPASAPAPTVESSTGSVSQRFSGTVLQFHVLTGSLVPAPAADAPPPWRVTAHECADACKWSPVMDQVIAPAAAPLDLTVKSHASTQTTYALAANVTAALALSFQVSPQVTQISMQSQGRPVGPPVELESTADARTVIVALTDGGCAKVARFPNLGVVLGPVLVRKVVVIAASEGIEITLTHEPDTAAPIPGNVLSVLYLSCTRLLPSGEWGSNFVMGPRFVGGGAPSI